MMIRIGDGKTEMILAWTLIRWITGISAEVGMFKKKLQFKVSVSHQNGAYIWITLEQSILRTMPLRNNWNDTQRCIILGTIQNIWRKVL